MKPLHCLDDYYNDFLSLKEVFDRYRLTKTKKKSVDEYRKDLAEQYKERWESNTGWNRKSRADKKTAIEKDKKLIEQEVALYILLQCPIWVSDYRIEQISQINSLKQPSVCDLT